jgi:hypothetical protein
MPQEGTLPCAGTGLYPHNRLRLLPLSTPANVAATRYLPPTRVIRQQLHMRFDIMCPRAGYGEATLQ